MDNLSESETKRRELSTTIQKLKRSGAKLKDIVAITGKDPRTVRKYMEGDPDILCRSNAASSLSCHDSSIIEYIQNGWTASAIARRLIEDGESCTPGNIRAHVKGVAKRNGLNLVTYNHHAANNTCASPCTGNVTYVTRKSIFKHVWMGEKIDPDIFRSLKDRYAMLSEIVRCVNDFKEMFFTKNMPRLYLFIERYMHSSLSVKELAAFASGLRKDIAAVENAVASPLSNGFVEGTNSKLKTLKKAMYGRCGIELLRAKLMYDVNSSTNK